MASFRAAKRFEAAVNTLLQVRINVELLLVDSRPLAAILFLLSGWCLGLLTMLSDFAYLHAWVQH